MPSGRTLTLDAVAFQGSICRPSGTAGARPRRARNSMPGAGRPPRIPSADRARAPRRCRRGPPDGPRARPAAPPIARASASSRRPSPRRRASGTTARLWTCTSSATTLEGAVGPDPALGVARRPGRAQHEDRPAPRPGAIASRRPRLRSTDGCGSARSSATSALRSLRAWPPPARRRRAVIARACAAPCRAGTSGRSSAGVDAPPRRRARAPPGRPSVPARKGAARGKPRVRHRAPGSRSR